MLSPLRTAHFRGAGLVVSLLLAAPNHPAHQAAFLDTATRNPSRRAGETAAVRRLAAEAAYAEAERLRGREDETSVRRAVGKYQESLALWKAAGDAGGMAKALRSLGQSYSRLGEPRRALDYLAQSLTLCPASRDAGCEAATRNELSASYLTLGELEKSWEHCSGALELSRAKGDRAGEARSLNNVGEVYYFRGDRVKALEHYRLALPIWKELGDLRGQAQTLLYLGYSQSDLGDARAAAAHYEQALALWSESKDERGQALTLTAIGHLHNGFGERQAALQYYDHAVPLFRRLGDRLGEARTLNGMGYLYKELGEGVKAVGYFNQARLLFRAVGYKSREATNLEVTGRAYYSMGRYRAALDSYQESLALIRPLDDKRSESLLLTDIGLAHAALGEPGKGLDYCKQALALNRKIQDRVNESYTLRGVARLSEELGEKRTALATYDQALTISREVGLQPDELESLYNIARVERDLGDWGRARAHVEEALMLGDALRTKIAGQEMRASYSATVHRLSELYIDTLMGLHGASPSEGLDARAFEASERRRARSLFETLAEGRKDIRQGVDAELLGRERELQQRITAKSARRVQLMTGRAPAEELAAVERELSDLTTEYQNLQGQIRAASPRYAALMQPVPLALGAIQQKILDADTVLLEYSLGERRSFVWVVTPDSIKSFEMPAREKLEGAALRVYELLNARNRRVNGETAPHRYARISRAENEYVEAAEVLGRMLLGPVAAELGRKRLVVVADGALQYVPFGALPMPGGGGGEAGPLEAAGAPGAGRSAVVGTPPQPEAGLTPLIARHEVVNLPSASVLAVMREELRGRRPALRSVAVLADPVMDKGDERLASAKAGRAARRGAVVNAPPGNEGGAAGAAQTALRSFSELGEGVGFGRLLFSRREADAIMSSLPAGDGMLALGFGASRAAATSQELAQYRVVHFATHGLLNSEHPELSGIVLSLFDEAGRQQDGFLQLYDVYNLRLPVDLVVLSACRTALGKEVKGEGLVGLTRGFMYAGAERVVASLWKVDDAATAELMGEFYRAMFRDGSTPPEALRRAQIYMWQQNRWRSPYYWAAFTIQGEWK